MKSKDLLLKAKAAATLEMRRRQRERLAEVKDLPLETFVARTKIKVPGAQPGNDSVVPFELWPAQVEVLHAMRDHDMLLILKARQLGISWLACAFIEQLCTLRDNQQVLVLSRAQREADQMIDRIAFLHNQHADRDKLPKLVKENTRELAWDNGSGVLSLPATKNAGRSFTASLVVLDEWAFMAASGELLGAIKPVIDAGGKLFIISSADGNGTLYHQFWEAAASGESGYKPIFLPWSARPERDADWYARKLAEANGDTSTVLREYPTNADEAFTNAVGVVYEGAWSDGPEDGSVTEAADYIPNGGMVVWAVDDGYSGTLDKKTGRFSADSHPRAFLLAQVRDDGRICVFAEHYQLQTLSNVQIDTVLELKPEGSDTAYPLPDWAVHGPGSAELRGRLVAAGLAPLRCQANVEEFGQGAAPLARTRQKRMAPGAGASALQTSSHRDVLVPARRGGRDHQSIRLRSRWPALHQLATDRHESRQRRST